MHISAKITAKTAVLNEPVDGRLPIAFAYLSSINFVFSSRRAKYRRAIRQSSSAVHAVLSRLQLVTYVNDSVTLVFMKHA